MPVINSDTCDIRMADLGAIYSIALVCWLASNLYLQLIGYSQVSIWIQWVHQVDKYEGLPSWLEIILQLIDLGTDQSVLRLHLYSGENTAITTYELDSSP